jgi:hypothetical protein
VVLSVAARVAFAGGVLVLASMLIVVFVPPGSSLAALMSATAVINGACSLRELAQDGEQSRYGTVGRVASLCGRVGVQNTGGHLLAGCIVHAIAARLPKVCVGSTNPADIAAW